MDGCFGKSVTVYRERLGMRQNALAERLGLTAGHLNRIEKGTRKPPGVATVLRMIDILLLAQEEAAGFLEAAGYSADALAGGRLAYDGPSTVTPSFEEIKRALERIPVERRERCIEALISLIEAFTK